MEVEGEILGLVILFLVVSAAFYFFIVRDSGDSEEVNLPDGSRNLSTTRAVNQTTGNATNGNNTTQNETAASMSFENIEELHWDHMPLAYRIVNNASRCEGAPIAEMKKAFEIVSKASSYKVNFTESVGNETADVNVSCVNRLELLKELKEKEVCKNVVLDYRSVQFSGYEVLADGDYVTSINIVSRNDSTNTYKVCYVRKSGVSFDWDPLDEASIKVKGGIISSARKTIYTLDSKYPSCIGFPAKEVHDVMHILGFAHTETPVFDDYYGWFFKDLRYFKDVMFPYSYCAYITELNDNYAECLKYIYSNGEIGIGCASGKFAG